MQKKRYVISCYSPFKSILYFTSGNFLERRYGSATLFAHFWVPLTSSARARFSRIAHRSERSQTAGKVTLQILSGGTKSPNSIIYENPIKCPAEIIHTQYNQSVKHNKTVSNYIFEFSVNYHYKMSLQFTETDIARFLLNCYFKVDTYPLDRMLPRPSQGFYTQSFTN